MDQDPDKGASLSATRRDSVRSRWARLREHSTPVPAPRVAQVEPVAPPPTPTPKKRKPVPATVADKLMPARVAIPFKAIIEAYHAAMPDNPRVRVVSKTTTGYIRQRWNEDKDRQKLEWWQQFFQYCASCPFLVGKVAPSGDRSVFFADLQWIARPTNFEKIVNGKYE